MFTFFRRLSCRRCIVVFISFLTISLRLQARVSLPPLIADGMVLQQQASVRIWGWAKPDAKVTVFTSWNNRTYTCTSGAGGAWQLRVATAAAGGPYTIRISDGEALTLKNVLLGEVWLCGGQSNMEMPVKGFMNQPILQSTQILMEADNSRLRLFRVERGMQRLPQQQLKSTSWQAADAASVKDFSAVGYLFAKRIQQQLNVPVGIIMSAFGGTKIEAWMDENSLKAFPAIPVRTGTDTSGIQKNEAAVLFNAMIAPLVGYNIRGVLWYQGEQNRPNYQQYSALMAAMVKEWRTIWQCGEWPFYYVQIAPYAYSPKDSPGMAPYLREAQAEALGLIPRAGMVVSMDVGSEKTIHPPDKHTLAERLACLALANEYGRTALPHISPAYASMTVTDTTAVLRFTGAPNGLSAFGKEIKAFEIAGDDHRFYPARAKITGAGITVYAAEVHKPVAVRYAFKDWVEGEVFNTEGFPLAPFRTDNW